MIPYIDQPTLALGSVTIHAFGVLLAVALLVGVVLFRRRSARVGLNPDIALRMVFWVLVSGLIGAHLVHALFYDFGATLEDPLSLLFVWDGISSFGGLLGGALGAALFFWCHPQGTDSLRYLDQAAVALPVGWFIGRVGCFFAFDHVGVPTDFFLGQTYLDGVVRHNLGLEEALVWIPIGATLFVLGRKQRQPGVLVGALAVLYAPARFLLDFLRVGDAGVGGLIVSQYGSIALFTLGAGVLWYVRRGRTATTSGEDDGRVAAPKPARRQTLLKYGLVLLIVGSGLILDQWTKQIAEARLAAQRPGDFSHNVTLTVPETFDGEPLRTYLAHEFSWNTPEELAGIATDVTDETGVLVLPTHQLEAGQTLQVRHRDVTVIPGYWEFEYGQNRGAAFSFLADNDSRFRTPFLVLASVIAVLIILWVLRQATLRQPVLIWGLSLMAAGALGNLINRVRLGYVIDFIVWKYGDVYRWPTFNVADVLICVGVALMMIEIMRDARRGRRELEATGE